MKINVYSKEGCGKCVSAKEKLERLKFPYDEVDIEVFAEEETLRKFWKKNPEKARDFLAHQNLNDGDLPVIEIDNNFYTYSEAMAKLKGVINAAKI